MGNNARLWAAQVEALANDYDVIVPDYLGEESIDAMADRVLEQVPAERFSLLGFSLGGYIALNLVDRVPARIQRLAFISSSPFADTEEISKQRRSLMKSAHADYRGLLRNMGDFIVNSDGPNAAHARETMLLMGEELGVDEFCRQQRATMQRADCTAMLSSVTCPAQVLCGADDPVTPVNGNRRIATEIPGASLQVLETAGHLLPLEKPTEVTEFIKGWMHA